MGAYTVPKIDVLLSGLLTSSAGIPLRADWTVTSAVAALSLGRPLSGNVTNVTVNLLKRDDLLNVLNLRTILVRNQGFIPGGAWLTPTGSTTPVVTARTATITVQYDF